MSTWIAVVLFVIGAVALVASIVMDRRPARRGAAAPAEAEAAATTAEPPPAEVVPAEPSPADVAPEPEPPAVIVTPEVAPASPGHEVTGAEGRLARLRAELTGAPEAAQVPGAPEAPEVPETAPAQPHETEAEEASGTGHTHALPLVNHGDLVTHLRREHADVESNGSTIQMRLLHEQAHATAG